MQLTAFCEMPHLARDVGRIGDRAVRGRSWRRRATGLTVMLTLAALVSPMGPTVAKKTAPVPVDLAKGSLTQSNCKTPIGCTHANVSVKSDRFASEPTSSQIVSNLLTLRVDGPWQKSSNTPVELAMNYRLLNPSGTAGNMICATAKTGTEFVHDCVRGLARTGRLALPLATRSADTLWIQFVAMPLAGGNTFEVTGAGLADSPRDVASADGTKVPIPIDLQSGQLRQVGCQVPVACRHPDVRLDAGVFSSKIAASQSGDQVVVSDGSDAAQAASAATGRLILEFPVPAVKKGLGSVLTFDHALAGANGAPGSIKVWSITGAKVISSVIDKVGAGRRSVAVGDGVDPVETVFVGFEPFATSDGGAFEVSNVSFGTTPIGESVPTTEATECTDCDPPASRLDPCGAYLDTYYVEAADGREGRGYRCVSRDGHGFFGEGWWNDFDWGRYAHLGYFANAPSDPDAVTIDFGFRRTIETSPGVTEDVEYGSRGPVGLNRDSVTAFGFRVFSPSGSVNENWRLIPKGELMPRFVGRMLWDGRCGRNGLTTLLPDDYSDRQNVGRTRCSLPTDLSDVGPAQEDVSLPFVWYGSGYLNSPRDAYGDTPELLARPHLGWLTEATSDVAGRYGAADRCVEPGPCDRFEEVEMIEVPPGHGFGFATDTGLSVMGPNGWGYVNEEGVRHPEHWVPVTGLGAGTALESPTTPCLDTPTCP